MLKNHVNDMGDFVLVQIAFQMWLCGYAVKWENGNVNLYKKATCGVLCLSFYVSLHMKLAEFWFKKSDACK